MREIRFRAWDEEAKNYASVVRLYVDKSIHAVTVITSLGDEITRPSYEYVIEQFTGLTDKNGVDIYDGDIVREGGNVGVIKFREDRAAFVCESRTATGGLYFQQMDVIGNIHENQELLDGDVKCLTQ